MIAEGVESLIHGEMLLLMGCDLAQGYGVAKPMPVENVKSWIAEYRQPEAWEKYQQLSHDVKHQKALFFRLTCTQWLTHFIESIEADKDQKHHWPTLESNKCHCAKWIRRARNENLYTTTWLDQFEHKHQQMHDVAKQIYNYYQNDNINVARSKIEGLQQVFNSLLRSLKV